ncbi:MAG TPA: TonB-dependent receptor, partial [Terriglobales bacterium]|nr:TonB-dependent receptor [Terriglobales bacterium]
MRSHILGSVAESTWRRSRGARLLCIAVPLLSFLFAVLPKPAFSQAYSASLTGEVTDSQGAAIPNVSIELKNSSTGEVRHTTTGADGRYVLDQLVPGAYELMASAPNFKGYVQRGITLLASRHASLDFTLQLGQVTQKVEVTAEAALLDTQSATVSSTLTKTMVTELPTNVRNPLALVLSNASAVYGIFGFPNANFDQTYSGFNLKGGRSQGSLILLDGAPDTAADWGGLLVAPSTESVQEMQFIESTYDAQFGRTEGGVVSLVTKSGTDKLHGEVYNFLRNDNLDANSWTNNRFGTPRQEFKRNQYGANVGGPIWKSKRLHFFAGYEGLRSPFSSTSGILTVPTSLERSGDFSQSYNPNGTLQVLFNPFSTRPDPNNPGKFIRDPFDPTCIGVAFPATCPGNKVPSSLMDPVGQKAAALFPQSNLPGDPVTHANNFFAAGKGSVVNDRMDSRVDWAHNEKHSMYARWSMRMRQNNNVPDFYGNGAAPLAFKSDKNPGYQGVWGNTYIPSPNWVFNVLVATGRWNESQISPALGKLAPASIGLNPAQFQAQLLPNFNLFGYGGLGDDEIRNFIRYDNSLQLNVTREKGAHSMKFGWIGEDALINNIDRFSASFSFDRGLTSGPTASTSSSSTGNSLASLLLGTGSGGGAPLNPDIAEGMRYYGFYGQDTWHYNKRLTLIYGLRWEVQPGATERFNRQSIFDPNLTNPLAPTVGLPLKGGVVFTSSDNRGLWETDKNNWAPRLGVVYKLTDKLVVRGGFGIFYMPASALITFDPGANIGFSTFTTWASTVGGGGLVPQDLLKNPFPNGKNQPTGSSAGLGTQTGQSLGQIWLKGPHPTGYQQNLSLNFQYGISPSRVIEVGYTGFRARKLMYGNPGLNMNQLSTSLLSLGSALDTLVPNPFFGTITSGSLSGQQIPENRLLRPFPEYTSITPARSLPGAKANFDSFTVKFTQQYRSGLSLISSYQWSKTLDDASEDQGWA